jgi:PAS domain S-box-containing protein
MINNEPEEEIKEMELGSSDLKSEEISKVLKKEVSFRQAIENSIPSGIAVVDSTGKQLYVNQSFCNMVGWSKEELLGKRPPYIYWSGQDTENIQNAFHQTLNNNSPKEGFDLVFCHKTGRLIPVNMIISSFVQEDGETYWLANVIDMTERKMEQEALIKSQLLLKSSIESQKDTIIFSIDRDYNYMYFNKAHWDSMKYAYNMDVKEGMNILDCIPSEDDRKLAKENYDRALSGESLTIIQTFGEVNRAYYESYFNPIVDENNKIIGCTGLARNITERKQAEEALRENETKFKEIIRQINDGIIVFDEQGKVIIWNDGAEKICGLNSDAILNQDIVDLHFQFISKPELDRSLIEKEIETIISMQNDDIFNRIIDDEIIAADSKNVKNIQRKVFPIKLNGYNLFCMVFRDITELKRYEKELLQISADKDKFYSIIAQYLYTPFNLFNNFSKLMAEELDTLPIKEIQKMAAMMSKSATNLYSLLDNLLQWTRMNQGKISFKPQKLNFLKTCQDAVSILKPNADAKNITINYFIKDELIVYADIFMLKTILRNLVSNAIKFTGSEGQIDISASKTGSKAIISISDNGSGITPDSLSKLFNNSKIHSTLDGAEEKGTTLGLLLCKEFVKEHGGEIWINSKNSKGSEFKFSIPIV